MKESMDMSRSSRRRAAAALLTALAAMSAGCYDISQGIVGEKDLSPPEHGSVVELVAGGDYTCALRKDGSAWCWGKLGEKLPQSSTPERVALPVGARKIAVGDGHACALLENSTVACWGENGNAQLGKSEKVLAHSQEPILVDGLYGAQDLWAGSKRTCAVDATGNLGCWGQDVRPNDAKASVGAFSPTAVVAEQGRVCWLSAGQVLCDDGAPRFQGQRVLQLASHSCVIALHSDTASTQVLCEGDAAEPELIDGGNPRRVAASVKRSCALVEPKSGDAKGRFRPCQKITPGKPGRAGQEQPDDPAECASAPTGWFVQCGGDPFIYQGKADEIAQETYTSITDPTAIALGGEHACVLRANGGVYCWGKNERGQLGDGSTRARTSLSTVTWPEE